MLVPIYNPPIPKGPGTIPCRVAYHRNLQFGLGETTEQARARLQLADPNLSADDRNVGDYAGKFSSIRHADSELDAGGLAEVTLDLTQEQRMGLHARRLKIIDGRLVPVTFEDRFGAAASKIKAAFGPNYDPDEPVSKDASQELIAEDQSRAIRVREIIKMLPKTITHTGTGYYGARNSPSHRDDTQSGAAVDHADGTFTITLTVGNLPGGNAYREGYVTNATETETAAIISHTDTTITLEANAGVTIANWDDLDDLDIYNAWSSGQGMFDAVHTDQGGADFATEQRCQFYDGTYTEDIVLNAALRPTLERRLVIQAAAGEDAVTLTNSGLAADTLNLNTVDCCYVEGMTINSTIVDLYGVAAGGGYAHEYDNIAITGSNNARGFSGGIHLYMHDCSYTGTRWGLFAEGRGAEVERSTFTGGSVGIYAQNGRYPIVRACVFDGMGTAIYSANASPTAPPGTLHLSQSTFYDCQYGVYDANGDGDDVLMLLAYNNIFETTNAADYAIYEPGAVLGRVEMDHNCYHGYTNPFHFSGADKSLAQWQALTDRQGDSPDAHSFEADPLMTDPAAGDFSLQAGSPCRHAGVGSGVFKDVDGDAYDPHHPDIGAVSSGIGPGTAVGVAG